MPDVDGGKTARIILSGCESVPGSGLSDPVFVKWAVSSLCGFLHLKRVGKPVVRRISPGLSCCLIIAESHLAIHTWPETSSVRVIIDCCVDFDHDDAAEWLKGVFGAEEYECLVV